MRTYSVFMINTHFAKLYRNKPRTLYQMLEQINKVNAKDFKFAFKLFEQIALPFNKLGVCKYIDKFDETHLKISVDTYILNDPVTREVTKLIVGTSNIKILTNQNNPLIFKLLQGYDDDLYVCDFENNDYFWLSKLNFKEEIK